MFTKKIIQNKQKIFLTALSLGMFLFFGATSVEAASISIRPGIQSVSVGDIISVKISIGTDGKYINNSEGTIQFPTDLLSVLSVSKSNSIFSLWVEEPRFSNIDGTISYNGGVPNPGFAGTNGEVLTITFKSKKQGTASLIFSGTSVRENDGLGTDILTSKQPGSIQIVESAKQKPVEQKPAAQKPINPESGEVVKDSLLPKPIILSSTHPQNDIWYKSKTASFSWSVGNRVTDIQASLNVKELTVPSVSYDGSVSRRTLNDLDDGVYYFNLRQKNNAGWSPTSHYKIQIDNTEPEDFTPIVEEIGYRNVVSLDATDKTSGVEYYELRVNEDAVVRVPVADLTDGSYTLNLQPKGTHILSVVAYDKAGNSRESKVTFVSPEIVPPVITLSSDSVEIGENITVSGTSIYKDSKVQVSVEFADGTIKKYDAITNNEGQFEVVVENIRSKGMGSVTVNMVLGYSTALSDSTEKLYFKIRNLKGIEDLTMILYPTLGVLVAVCAVLATLFALYFGWHKFFSLRRRYKKDLEDTIENVHTTMLVLKKELRSQLKTLKDIKKDRELSPEESKIFEDIQNNIDDVEDFIEEKIKKLM